MKEENKRIFIKDIPRTITEGILEKEFSHYGTVTSIEIKQRKSIGDSSNNFAYINLETNSTNLKKCFNDFANQPCEGQYLQLQMAQESFLERLKREREESVNPEPVIKHEPIVNSVNDSINIRIPNNLSKGFEENKSTIKSNHEIKVAQVNGKPSPSPIKKVQSVAETKRLASLTQMKQTYQHKKSAIQAALSNIESKSKNRITFGDDETVSNLPSCSKNKRLTLFNDDDENDLIEDVNFEIKSQFEGKKGQKLLELQSRFNKDKRFAMDERFLEDENESENENVNYEDEQQEQLKILGEVLGKTFDTVKKNPEKIKKSMLRFDPTQVDHSKYEIKQQEKMTTREKRKVSREEAETEKPQVSKEKYYKVSDALKQSLEEKPVNEGFSLLSLFGRNEVVQEAQPAEQPQKIGKGSSGPNPFRYDSSDNEDEEETVPPVKILEKKNERVQMTWNESFFFKDDDYRLQEGLDFIKGLETEGHKEFGKMRRDIKLIIKAKMKNNQRKIRPFKKKLGGRRKMTRGKKNHEKKVTLRINQF